MDTLGALIGALESLDEDTDSSPLLRAAAVDGVQSCLARGMDGSSLALCMATCKAAFATFGAADLWAEKLEESTGASVVATGAEGEGAVLRRAFAHEAVCARWSLPRGATAADSPRTTGAPRRTARRTAATPLALQYQNDATPATPPSCPRARSRSSPPGGKENEQNENEPPALTQQLSDPALVRHRHSAQVVQACAKARLQRDLHDLMLGAASEVTACPEEPGEWDVWSARVGRSGGGGVDTALRLRFDVDSADSIPRVSLSEPALAHPNVDSSGVLCDAALRRRCSPIASVREVLQEVAVLLERPCFSVVPLNQLAAAGWFNPAPPRRAARRLASGGC